MSILLERRTVKKAIDAKVSFRGGIHSILAPLVLQYLTLLSLHTMMELHFNKVIVNCTSK